MAGIDQQLKAPQPEMRCYRDLIDSDALREALGEPSWRLVDCRFDLLQTDRGQAEYRQDHIPGAVYAHLDKDLAGPVTASSGRHPLPAADKFADTLGAWGIGRDSQVIVYDHGSGAIAARLWWMLRWVGHECVAVLDGGFAAWQKAAFPLSDSVEQPPRTEFRPRPDAGLVISTEELVAAMQTGDVPAIVDARDSGRFAGRHEPIDTVAGHVPGAVNFPVSESLGAGGRWKRADELKGAWAEILGQEPRRWIAMCGSGVTACHLALSAQIAGYPKPRLYVGSWSEWIRDPARPVARG